MRRIMAAVHSSACWEVGRDHRLCVLPGGRRQQQGMLSLEEAAAGRGRDGFVWVGLFEPDLAELATGHLRPEMPPRPGQPDIHGGHRIPVGV